MLIYKLPVHTNDDHSDEVFVCPETTAETRQAYSQVGSVKSDPKAIRGQIKAHFNRWYEASVELGKDVDVEPAVPRIANRQQHCDNVPAVTPVK